MRELLQVHLQDRQYRAMLTRYHFVEHDLEQLKQIGGLVESEASPAIYYDVIGENVAVAGVRDSAVKTERVAVIVTLGSGVDELQDRYMLRERLTEGYMVECVSMELLRLAYEQAAEHIHERLGGWMSGFQFVGDQIPFEHMEEIFGYLAPQEVNYNEAYMLRPKKTVVFLTNLCDERAGSYCHICEDCTNLTCQNRNLTYGFQRIFGERG